MQDVESGVAVNLTQSGVVSSTPGTLLGFYVNSTNAGTIVIRNGGASGTVLSGTITPAVGYHSFRAYCTTACYATIGGTALNVTLFFAAG